MEIIVKTDNKNLINIKENYDSKNGRWGQICNEYNVKFVQLPGKENIVVDYISRNVNEKKINSMNE